MRFRSLNELCYEIGDAACRCLREACGFCRFLQRMLRATGSAICRPRRIKWRSVAFYMDSCGSDAMPIIALLGTLIGVILAFQAIVQLGRYGVESYVVNLVGSVIVTELAPLVTAVVLAGRSGSSFAAEIGTMKSAEELDAMVTMGFDTDRFLLFPKLLALLAVMPGLTIIADFCGIVGGMAIVCANLDISIPEYYHRTVEVVRAIDLFQGIFKSFFFALIIAAVGCMKGFEAERDSQGVGKSATSAVVTSIFLIVVADALLTAGFSAGEGFFH